MRFLDCVLEEVITLFFDSYDCEQPDWTDNGSGNTHGRRVMTGTMWRCQLLQGLCPSLTLKCCSKNLEALIAECESWNTSCLQFLT